MWNFFDGLCIGILIGFFPIGAIIWSIYKERSGYRTNKSGGSDDKSTY